MNQDCCSRHTSISRKRRGKPTNQDCSIPPNCPPHKDGGVPLPRTSHKSAKREHVGFVSYCIFSSYRKTFAVMYRTCSVPARFRVIYNWYCLVHCISNISLTLCRENCRKEPFQRAKQCGHREF